MTQISSPSQTEHRDSQKRLWSLGRYWSNTTVCDRERRRNGQPQESAGAIMYKTHGHNHDGAVLNYATQERTDDHMGGQRVRYARLSMRTQMSILKSRS